MFERCAGRSKKLCAIRRDVHSSSKPNAKFAGQINTGFVAESHSGRQRKSIAANQVWPLVAIQADAMAEAVREVFVAGTITGVADYLARGGIDGLAFDARSGGLESGFLRPVETSNTRFISSLAVP